MKRTPVVLALSVLVPLAVVAACSSTDSSSSSSSSGGSDASASDATNFPDVGKVDSGKADTGGGGPTTYDECVAVCDKQHPAAVAKDKKILDCWDTKCATSCGSAPDGGPDLPGTDGGKCTQAVDTGDAKCDTCTNANCCAEWDGCFGDKDCSDYETCLADCDQNFP